MDNAARRLQIADEIKSAVRATPIQLSIYARSKLEFLLCQLEASLECGDKSAAVEFRMKAAKACRLLIKTTKKSAQHRTEALRLKGVYYWLIKKPGRAFKWLEKAVREGERLDARLELSRTYFEIGRRLMESDDRYNDLNGVKADEYLDKATTLFVAMNLQWDLDRLEQLPKY
ncbi:MAG: hypothetical protein JJV98_20740 [Desulfosarcina sp.]|nr:hypothetical protein [Desulfobacterales bacterium]